MEKEPKPFSEEKAGEKSEADLANEQIREDFELSKKALDNLKFGGGVKETEEGNLYTKIADVFVHEDLRELDEKKTADTSLFSDTPEGAEERRGLIEFLGALDSDEKIEGRGISNWSKKEKSYYFLLQGSSFGRMDKEELLSYLTNPEKYKQVYSLYANWAENNFNPGDIPNEDDLKKFEKLGINTENYFYGKLQQEGEAIKEKIKQNPFVAKALSCLELVDGKLQIREGKGDIIKQLREAYAGDINPENISLLMIGAGLLFPGVSDKRETSFRRYANSRSEIVVKTILDEAKYFKDNDHDGPNRYRTVFDPANIIKVGEYSEKSNVLASQEAIYAIYGLNGGLEVIKNLDYIGEQGSKKIIEQQRDAMVAGYFENAEIAEDLKSKNPALYKYFEDLILRSQSLNSPGDTVRHHLSFNSVVVDKEYSTMAYIKTSGSSDSSPYSSNPYTSDTVIVVWKDGKEDFVDADDVESVKLENSENNEINLLKQMKDGTVQSQTI